MTQKKKVIIKKLKGVGKGILGIGGAIALMYMATYLIIIMAEGWEEVLSAETKLLGGIAGLAMFFFIIGGWQYYREHRDDDLKQRLRIIEMARIEKMEEELKKLRKKASRKKS